jgi:hypothetical protein
LMRILIGTYEICGWVNLFQKAFNKLGHRCDTLVKIKHHFYASSRYTFNASRYHIRIRFKSGRLRSIVQRINDSITNRYLSNFVRKNVGKYDVVIYIWDTILPSFSDVEKFRQNGAKIIFLFAGSDVRTYLHFTNTYDASHWVFPDYWVKENIERKQLYVQTAEKYADLIYSVPDQAGLQKRPYYHLQIPIDLSNFVFRNNKRRVPNVLHLPSDPWKKGTDIIEKVIGELIAEGVKINFFSYRNLSHEKVSGILQDIDILVDQIVFHGPGVLGFEAMASGCAVATRYLESSPAIFRPPVWNINADNIKIRLAELFCNYDLQQKMIIDGREYVELYNSSVKVADDILNNLANRNPADYII